MKNIFKITAIIVLFAGITSCEEYVDVKKDKLSGLTYDKILKFLKNTRKAERLDRYKAFLRFRNIPYDADLFTWNNSELN